MDDFSRAKKHLVFEKVFLGFWKVEKVLSVGKFKRNFSIGYQVFRKNQTLMFEKIQKLGMIFRVLVSCQGMYEENVVE
jgi:hypothetical protein